MPSWKKVIVSGSNAVLNSLQVNTAITASVVSASSFTGSLLGAATSAQSSTQANFVGTTFNTASSYLPLVYSNVTNTSYNAFFFSSIQRNPLGLNYAPNSGSVRIRPNTLSTIPTLEISGSNTAPGISVLGSVIATSFTGSFSGSIDSASYALTASYINGSVLDADNPASRANYATSAGTAQELLTFYDTSSVPYYNILFNSVSPSYGNFGLASSYVNLEGFVYSPRSSSLRIRPDSLSTLPTLEISGSDFAPGISVSGSIIATSFTGSLQGTSSYALTASYALSSPGGSGVTINNNVNNYLLTATGVVSTLDGESNLSFDGSTLSVSGSLILSGSYGITYDSTLQTLSHGFQNISNRQGAYAQGFRVTASAEYSHAEGNQTYTNATGSHAEGRSTRVEGVNASFGHAEGENTLVTGRSAHAEGSSSIAFGIASHAGGWGTVASGAYQTVYGQWNALNNTSDLFVIGGGTSTVRRDIFNVSTSSIRISGSTTITGSLTITTTTSSFGTFTASAHIVPIIKAGVYVSGAGSWGGTPVLTSSIVNIIPPFPNNSYSVVFTAESASRNFTIRPGTKTSGSFVINSNSATQMTGSIFWVATSYTQL